jgi:hypothetical protein
MGLVYSQKESDSTNKTCDLISKMCAWTSEQKAMNLRLNGHNATVCFQNPEIFHQSIFQSPPFRPGTTHRAHVSLWWSQSHPNSQSGALRRRCWSWRWLEAGPGKISPVSWRQKKTPQSHAGRRNSICPLGKEHLEPMGDYPGWLVLTITELQPDLPLIAGKRHSATRTAQQR